MKLFKEKKVTSLWTHADSHLQTLIKNEHGRLHRAYPLHAMFRALFLSWGIPIRYGCHTLGTSSPEKEPGNLHKFQRSQIERAN